MIQSYKNFHSKNEGLSKSDKYILKNAIYIIGNRLISWIIKAEPLLNEIYHDLKKQTKDLQSHGSAGHSSVIKNIEKIDLSEIKGTKYYRGLYRLINNRWKLYKQNLQTGDFYYLLSKDELKDGDQVTGTHKNWKVHDKRIAVCAKYDNNEFLESSIEEIKDAFSDLELNYDTTINSINGNRENSLIRIKFDSRERLGKKHYVGGNKDESSKFFNEEMMTEVMNGIHRSINILKSIGEKWDYTLYYWDRGIYMRRHESTKDGWVNIQKIEDITTRKDSELYLVLHKKGIAEHNLKYLKPSLPPDYNGYYK